MIDGLKQENYLGGSVFSDFVSGIDAQFNTATIPTITANTGLTALATIKAGSDALSSGSRWVAFGTAFSNANYHAVASARVAIAGEPYSAIGTGSKAAGSFIALGSPAGASFDWVALARAS